MEILVKLCHLLVCQFNAFSANSCLNSSGSIKTPSFCETEKCFTIIFSYFNANSNFLQCFSEDFCLNDKRKIRLLCGKVSSHGPKCSIGGNENRLSLRVKQANVSCETLACFTYYHHRTLFVVLCGSRILGYGDLTNLFGCFS